ncbi:pentatricopeptide repeat (PPR) superfamily protein [Tasmannia lanceolata]|uniref:pentatricopeptide repeat (PPR) superfamily protein n=1 Tax=Tasmannia lanceolata TaxID=3420 RepID=UPI00406290E7
MAPTRCSLLGSFSHSLVSRFPRKIAKESKTSNRYETPCKLFVRNISRLNSSCFSHSAVCQALDDFSDGETVRNLDGITKRDGFDFLYSMEERGLRADRNTYVWLLEGCLNSGSLVNAKKVHGRILKSGFGAECELGNQLIDVYLCLGHIDDAVKVFDNMTQRSVASCNNIITGFLAKKLNNHVLGFFSRIIKECTKPDSVAFACVLRACSGGNVPLRYVEQLHAKIFRYGFGSDLIIGNPLVDLYSKNGNVHLAWSVFEELCSRNSVAWVAMISGFSQNGYGEEALHLFCQMISLGVLPTPYVFSCVLGACTKIGSFEHGKQLHAQVLKWGFRSETFVGNALITLYSRCGNMSFAEQIFDEMVQHDAITYNSLISGYAQCGNSDCALQFFKKMKSSGLKPDCVTIASLLSACASIGALYKGKQLHSHIIKVGISPDIIIEGSLLDLYVKCADIKTAHDFFDTTNRKNVVLWNVMLVAYGQMGDILESFELFSQMQVTGVKPNQYTYPSILRTCTSVGALDLGEQIHTQIIKSGFEANVYVCSVLIDMYAKCGRLKTAREILERQTEEDVVSWTAMIAGYAHHQFCVEALRIFEEMQIRGIRSDNIGFSSALSACAGIQALEQGLQIHAQAFVSGYSKDLSIGNSLVNLYARCGRTRDAYSAFEMIEAKDEISWNGLISGFAQSGHCEEALLVFSWMNREAVGANLFTFGSAISASANIADIKQGMQIHARMIKAGYDSEVEAGNVLITLYSKCGSIDDARKEFYEMAEKNEVSWNAMITGSSQHGHGAEALKLFEQMKQQGLKPNHVTFVGVLSACSHVGLVNDGLSYFKSMSLEYDIHPRIEHYACVVDILGRAGLLDRAREFIEEMPMDPDAMVWRTLLSACRVHRNTGIGEFAAQHLFELEPHDSATYVLLSNIYAIARKWDLRDKMRQSMKDRGVKKEPGRSWIEVKNSVHAFFVGDRLHPLTDKIYEFLYDLNKRLGGMGYVQDQYSLLHDTEQDLKDPSVYIHSEKLAVAFGLISLSPEIPIRIIKNLRVCNDCHNWMKFVTRISCRSVIVRDAYRFHHFDGGVCSCGDYW